MRYDLVLLDLDDTVFDYEKTEDHALRTVFDAYGIKYLDEYGHIYSAINKLLWSIYEKKGISSEKLRVERFRRLLKEIGRDPGDMDLEAFSGKYLAALSDKVFFEPYAREAVSYIKNSYKLVFLTNGICDVQKKRLIKAGMYEGEKSLVTSDSAGTPKPSREIVEFAVRIAGNADLKKTILIGDSMESDIKTANISGISSIWYNRKGRPAVQGIFADHEIKSLSEIRGLL